MEHTFFIDRCFGRYVLADALREAGLRCEVHDDHFEQDTKDVEWIPVVAEKGWIAVTRDDRIKRNAEEKDALIRSQLAMLVMSKKNNTTLQLAERFITAQPVIERFLKKNPPPFIASVRPPSKGRKRGSVHVLWPPERT